MKPLHAAAREPAHAPPCDRRPAPAGLPLFPCPRPAQVAVGEQRWNRDDQAGRGRNERLTDTARQCARVTDTRLRNRVEGRDHPGHGAEQSEQGRHGGNRAERVQEPLEFVDHVPSGILDHLFHDLAPMIAVGKPRGQHPAQRGVARERLDVPVIQGSGFNQFPHTIRQLAWNDALALQCPKTLDHDGHGDHRAQDDRRHNRAAGNDDFPHAAA